MLHLGYAIRLVACPGGPDEKTCPPVEPCLGTPLGPPRPPAESDEPQPVSETRVLCHRQWRHLTAQIHCEPSFVPPTLIASAPQTKLILLLSGSMHVTQDKYGRPRRSQLCRPGTLNLRPAHRPDYELEWHSVSSEPVRSLHLFLDNELLAQVAAADAGLDAARLELPEGYILDDPLLTQLCYALAQELSQPEAQGELYADTVARMLAVQLIRRHGTVRPREPSRALREAALSARVMGRIADYVRVHLHRSIALEELAAVACLSPFHFARAFRRTAGKSPNAYVIAQRMARAAHLLRRRGGRQLTVAHVAAKVGYQSAPHFSWLFARHTGCPPGAYARRRLG